MGKTTKDTIKALKKASRKNNPLPQNKVVPDKKKVYKRKPKFDKGYDAMCYVPVGG